MSKFTAILAVCLITFTSLLIIKTLQIQHSCSPMIDWGGKISAKCQVVMSNNSKFDEPETITRLKPTENTQHTKSTEIIKKSSISQLKVEQKSNNSIILNKSQNNNNSEKESNKIVQFIQEHSEDEIGIVAGGIAAGTAAATVIASAPITGAVLIGLGVWFLIRTGLKLL